jgi:hypothetical protein
MVGFIFMIDEFRNHNGATRFVPGSHLWSDVPTDLRGDRDRKADYPGQVLACGPAGSLILVLHDNLDKRAFYAAFRKATNSVLVAAKRCAFSSR